jgi:chromosome partitioning protein
MNTPRTRARITAIVNQKGGVGKTTTTINLGGALAAAGRSVLLVDLDPTGHLTDMLRLNDGYLTTGLATALIGATPIDLAELVISHSSGVDAIPTSLDMLAIDDDMRAADVLGREMRLSRVLAPLAERYQHVLIDCPPSLGLLTNGALTACDEVIIPLQTEDTSVHALTLLFRQIDAVNDALRPDRPIVIRGLVVSMVERGAGGLPKSNIARSVLESYQELPVPIIASVPRGVPIAEAVRFGKTVEEYAPRSEHAGIFRDLAGMLV